MSLLTAIAHRKVYFLTAAAVLVLDQATKIAAHAWLRSHSAVEVIPNLFNLDYSRNPGGLFGYFGELPDPWRAVLLTALPVVAIGMIVHFLARSADIDRKTLTGLALILGGAVGNLVDRIARGEVVDFLDVYAASPRLAAWLVERFGTAHWPTFNFADSGIVCGAGLLIWAILRPGPAVGGDPTAADVRQ